MSTKPKALTFLDAAIQVLRTSGETLTTAELTARFKQSGLVRSTGKTPAATLSASLYRYLRSYPRGAIRRIAQAGETRAARGSVRWTAR